MQGTLKPSFTMRGGLLGQLPIFLTVAELRSFSAAARALKISPSAVSQAIARLEREFGAALLVRTTRSVAPTDAGLRLLSEVGPAIANATASLAAFRSHAEEPAGTLRLNVPHVAVRVALAPLLAEFAQRHPQVRTEVAVEDHLVDIVGRGFDAGIRPRELVRQDMIRVRIAPPMRMVVAASKRYLSEHGRPKHPRELVELACLGWRSSAPRAEARWTFVENGRALQVAVSGPVISDDLELLVGCAERHLGFIYAAEPEIASRLASGKLVKVLDAYALELPGLFLYYPRAAREVPRLRAFVACVREQVRVT